MKTIQARKRKSDELAEQRLVEVDGHGEVMVPPDALGTSVSVEVRAETLQAAREEAANKTNAIIKALDDLQVEALQVRTVGISVRPILEFHTEPGKLPKVVGYEATSELAVTLEGVAADAIRAEAPRILDAALSSGASTASDIRFYLSNPGEARRRALKASIEDAEKNARVIADAAKINLVAWQSVSTRVKGSSARASSRRGAAPATTFPVEPGDLQVTAEVTAQFQFVNP